MMMKLSNAVVSDDADVCEYVERIGTILCCGCGTSITPNAANMCGECVRQRVDLSIDCAKQSLVIFCKECARYQRGTQWLAMELESAELLALCLKRIKGLDKLKLVDAGFIWTEPHSRRLKVKVTVQAEASQLNSVIVQQSFITELIVQTQQCVDCQRSYTEHTWKACLQVRQKVAHKKTFLLLEQLILKHGMNSILTNVAEAPGGLDMFFSNKGRAMQMLDFVQSVVPIKSKQSKRLVSQDFKSNTSNYKYTFYAEIVPISSGDLICLPKNIAQSCGGINPLLLCTRVTSSLKLVDVETLQSAEIPGSLYWRSPFRSLLNSRHLIEYIILNVVKTDNTQGKLALADVTCARSSDFGVNDTIFEIVSHLGNILNSGDTAMGYDLTCAVFNDDDLKPLGARVTLPDVVLVKKTYRRINRNRKRKFQLKSLNKKKLEISRRNDSDRIENEEEEFLREVEEDLELRCRINLYARNDKPSPCEAANRTIDDAGEDDDDDDDAAFPDVQLDELIQDFDTINSDKMMSGVKNNEPQRQVKTVDNAEVNRKRKNIDVCNDTKT